MPLIILLPFLTGCPGPCEGAGCEDAYSATTLSVHEGSRALAARTGQAPLGGELVLRGSEAESLAWTLVLDEDLLLVGLPELAQVRSLRLSELGDGSLASQPHGLLQGPAGSRFGASIAQVPDRDGDGQKELWVGAPDLAPGEALPEAGGAFLFSGLGEGFTGEPALAPSLRLAGEAPFDHLGEQLEACADMDGDGLPELAVAAPWDELEAPLAGRVHLLLSGQELLGEQPVGSVELSWTSTAEGAALGRDLSCQHRHQITLGVPGGERLVEDARGVLVLAAGGKMRVQQSGRLPPQDFERPAAATLGRLVDRLLRGDGHAGDDGHYYDYDY